MKDNKIKFYFVFAIAGRIIYWIIVAAISFLIWKFIVEVTDGYITILLASIAGAIEGLVFGLLWCYLYED